MKFPHIIYGGDYNPEQWTPDIWQEDVHLMQEAGVNLVSLGIFSWTKLEPKPGEFDFTWLDQIIELLHAHNVSINLATPTASPPAWMVKLHPDMLPITAEGVRLWHGSRRHYCPHNLDYRNYAKRIATQLAERYKDHPALFMWHVDNEYACHNSECFCDTSAAAFRVWLKEKYKTLSAFNEAWGTAFWSQTYGDWEEIHPPKSSPAHANPTQKLDWARFTSDSWLLCFEEQKTILKQITPHIPVTTNFMSFFKPIDYWKFAKQEDVVALDNYPDTFDPEWMIQAGMSYDMIRSIGERNPWILMEQATSQVNWRERNAVKRPGVMRLGSYQAIARGSNGIMFFQWRQSKAGAEKHHSGMVPLGGTETRVWREVKELGNQLKKLDLILTSRVQADVAFLMDWNSWWALELDSKPSSDLKFIPQLYHFYKPFFEHNITVDFAHPEADLSRYKLVVAPNLYLVNDASIKNINEYVQSGGNVLMSFFSGIVDENEHTHLESYLAPFQETFGLVVEEFAPYAVDQINAIKTTDGKQFPCTFWSDVIQTKKAKSLAVFEKDYYAGNPAVTQNQFGQGNAFYVGTLLDSAGMDWLIESVCKTTDVKFTNLSAGVEVLQRVSDEAEFMFVLNYADTKTIIPIERSGTDLLSGNQVSQSVELDPAGVAIIRLD